MVKIGAAGSNETLRRRERPQWVMGPDGESPQNNRKTIVVRSLETKRSALVKLKPLPPPSKICRRLFCGWHLPCRRINLGSHAHARTVEPELNDSSPHAARSTATLDRTTDPPDDRGSARRGNPRRHGLDDGGAAGVMLRPTYACAALGLSVATTIYIYQAHQKTRSL